MGEAIDTIGKLLHHAEHAASEAEAEAFYAKAQQLASRHAIDLALAAQRHQRARRAEVVTSRRVTVVPDGLPAFYRKAYVRLFSQIAWVNDLKVDVARDASHVVLFGFPSDLDVVQRLYASLLVQMVAACDRRVRAKAHHRTPEGRVDARRYRNSFYRGYADTIGTRLGEARRLAEGEAASSLRQAEDGPGTVALVLAEKRAKVDAHHRATSDARGTWSGSGARLTGAGLRAGAADARRASLGSRGALGGAAGELAG